MNLKIQPLRRPARLASPASFTLVPSANPLASQSQALLHPCDPANHPGLRSFVPSSCRERFSRDGRERAVLEELRESPAKTLERAPAASRINTALRCKAKTPTRETVVVRPDRLELQRSLETRLFQAFARCIDVEEIYRTVQFHVYV